MPIEFAYQVVKDLVALTKMKEADPIDPGTNDVPKLKALGITEEGWDYSWIRPRRQFGLTEAPSASHEVVWVAERLRRSKRKVVRRSGSGAVDLILVRRKAT